MVRNQNKLITKPKWRDSLLITKNNYILSRAFYLRVTCFLCFIIVSWHGVSFGQVGQIVQGDTSCKLGDTDCNRCVKDVIKSVKKLRTHGDVLGFHPGQAPDATRQRHWQGIQRLPDKSKNILVVTSTNGSKSGVSSVNMDSRRNGGLRVGSNRLRNNSYAYKTPPPPVDRVTNFKEIDSHYSRASGFQMVGNFAAIGLDGSDNRQNAKVVIYDFSDPNTPVEISDSALSSEDYGRTNARTTSITKLNNGKYLLIVGEENAKILNFYISKDTDIENTGWEPFTIWKRGDLEDGMDRDWRAYQNINVVNQCDGKLYLLASLYRTERFPGAPLFEFDVLIAFSLGLDMVNKKALISKVSGNLLYCKWKLKRSTSPRHCHFNAAAGIYVDPEGELNLYATEHGNNGPVEKGQPGTIKMAEFRSSTKPSACKEISKGWVELYSDKNWKGRGLRIDYGDRHKRHYRDFRKLENFGDRTDSGRWCLPKGWRYVLYDHDSYQGDGNKKVYPLYGKNKVRQFGELVGFGSGVSSGRFECLYGKGWTSDTAKCEGIRRP